jgi:hypothetical protein
MVQRKAALDVDLRAAEANYLLDEWPEGLLARTANPSIPVFVVSAIDAHPEASQGAGCGYAGA